MQKTTTKVDRFKSFIKILKWGKLIAKLTAIGTTISGAVTALSGSATAGITISAAGATTYAATKGLPTKGYEKTKHIPPGRINKEANLLRHQEIANKSIVNPTAKGPGKSKPTTQAGMLAVKQPSTGKRSVKSGSMPKISRKT